MAFKMILITFFVFSSVLIATTHRLDHNMTYKASPYHHDHHGDPVDRLPGNVSLIQHDEEDDLEQIGDHISAHGDNHDENKVWVKEVRRPEDEYAEESYRRHDALNDTRSTNSSDTILPFFTKINDVLRSMIITGNRTAHKLADEISKISKNASAPLKDGSVVRPERKQRSLDALWSSFPSIPTMPSIPTIPVISGLNGQSLQSSVSNQLEEIMKIVHSISSEEMKAFDNIYSNISSTVIAQSVNGTNITVVELLSGPGMNTGIGASPQSNVNGSQGQANELPRKRRTLDSLWPMLMNPSLVLPDLDSSASSNGQNHLVEHDNMANTSTRHPTELLHSMAHKATALRTVPRL